MADSEGQTAQSQLLMSARHHAVPHRRPRHEQCRSSGHQLWRWASSIILAEARSHPLSARASAAQRLLAWRSASEKLTAPQLFG
jgi:hypothetical protein